MDLSSSSGKFEFTLKGPSAQDAIAVSTQHGYLLKKSSRGHGLLSWRKRYFVLSERQLYIYAHAQESEPHRVVNLDRYDMCTQVKAVDESDPYPFCFQILNVRHNVRSYLLALPSGKNSDEAEMRRWISAISDCIIAPAPSMTIPPMYNYNHDLISNHHGGSGSNHLGLHLTVPMSVSPSALSASPGTPTSATFSDGTPTQNLDEDAPLFMSNIGNLLLEKPVDFMTFTSNLLGPNGGSTEDLYMNSSLSSKRSASTGSSISLTLGGSSFSIHGQSNGSSHNINSNYNGSNATESNRQQNQNQNRQWPRSRSNGWRSESLQPLHLAIKTSLSKQQRNSQQKYLEPSSSSSSVPMMATSATSSSSPSSPSSPSSSSSSTPFIIKRSMSYSALSTEPFQIMSEEINSNSKNDHLDHDDDDNDDKDDKGRNSSKGAASASSSSTAQDPKLTASHSALSLNKLAHSHSSPRSITAPASSVWTPWFPSSSLSSSSSLSPHATTSGGTLTLRRNHHQHHYYSHQQPEQGRRSSASSSMAHAPRSRRAVSETGSSSLGLATSLVEASSTALDNSALSSPTTAGATSSMASAALTKDKNAIGKSIATYDRLDEARAQRGLIALPSHIPVSPRSSGSMAPVQIISDHAGSNSPSASTTTTSAAAAALIASSPSSSSPSPPKVSAMPVKHESNAESVFNVDTSTAASASASSESPCTPTSTSFSTSPTPLSSTPSFISTTTASSYSQLLASPGNSEVQGISSVYPSDRDHRDQRQRDVSAEQQQQQHLPMQQRQQLQLLQSQLQQIQLLRQHGSQDVSTMQPQSQELQQQEQEEQNMQHPQHHEELQHQHQEQQLVQDRQLLDEQQELLHNNAVDNNIVSAVRTTVTRESMYFFPPPPPPLQHSPSSSLPFSAAHGLHHQNETFFAPSEVEILIEDESAETKAIQQSANEGMDAAKDASTEGAGGEEFPFHKHDHNLSVEATESVDFKRVPVAPPRTDSKPPQPTQLSLLLGNGGGESISSSSANDDIGLIPTENDSDPNAIAKTDRSLPPAIGASPSKLATIAGALDPEPSLKLRSTALAVLRNALFASSSSSSPSSSSSSSSSSASPTVSRDSKSAFSLLRRSKTTKAPRANLTSGTDEAAASKTTGAVAIAAGPVVSLSKKTSAINIPVAASTGDHDLCSVAESPGSLLSSSWIPLSSSAPETKEKTSSPSQLVPVNTHGKSNNVNQHVEEGRENDQKQDGDRNESQIDALEQHRRELTAKKMYSKSYTLLRTFSRKKNRSPHEDHANKHHHHHHHHQQQEPQLNSDLNLQANANANDPPTSISTSLSPMIATNPQLSRRESQVSTLSGISSSTALTAASSSNLGRKTTVLAWMALFGRSSNKNKRSSTSSSGSASTSSSSGHANVSLKTSGISSMESNENGDSNKYQKENRNDKKSLLNSSSNSLSTVAESISEVDECEKETPRPPVPEKDDHVRMAAKRAAYNTKTRPTLQKSPLSSSSSLSVSLSPSELRPSSSSPSSSALLEAMSENMYSATAENMTTSAQTNPDIEISSPSSSSAFSKHFNMDDDHLPSPRNQQKEDHKNKVEEGHAENEDDLANSGDTIRRSQTMGSPLHANQSLHHRLQQPLPPLPDEQQRRFTDNHYNALHRSVSVTALRKLHPQARQVEREERLISGSIVSTRHSLLLHSDEAAALVSQIENQHDQVTADAQTNSRIIRNNQNESSADSLVSTPRLRPRKLKGPAQDLLRNDTDPIALLRRSSAQQMFDRVEPILRSQPLESGNHRLSIMIPAAERYHLLHGMPSDVREETASNANTMDASLSLSALSVDSDGMVPEPIKVAAVAPTLTIMVLPMRQSIQIPVLPPTTVLVDVRQVIMNDNKQLFSVLSTREDASSVPLNKDTIDASSHLENETQSMKIMPSFAFLWNGVTVDSNKERFVTLEEMSVDGNMTIIILDSANQDGGTPKVLSQEIVNADAEVGIVFTEKPMVETSPFWATTPQMIKIIRGGTIEKLVERLTFHEYYDSQYNAAFMLTYTTICTPRHLLQLLKDRFAITSPAFFRFGALSSSWDGPSITKERRKDDLDKSSATIYQESVILPIRLRVFNFIKLWIEQCFEDFMNDSQLIEDLQEFIDIDMRAMLPTATGVYVDGVLDTLQRKSLRKITHELHEENKPPPPPPILPKNFPQFTLIELDPTEIARQLTLIEFEIFRAIKPHELLHQAWNRDHDEAQNVIKFIERFNSLSHFVATEVVLADSIRKRVAVINQSVLVAEKCYQMNNFNSMMSILSGLTSSAVFRMKKSWESVKKGALLKLDEMQALMSSGRNFHSYRQHLKGAGYPCLPFLGMYLTDLVFIDDGNQDFLANSSAGRQPMVNFDKRRRMAEVIQEIRSYQRVSYSFVPIYPIQEYCCVRRNCSEDELYELSLDLEPRMNVVSVYPEKLL